MVKSSLNSFHNPSLRFSEFDDEWQISSLGDHLKSVASGKSNTSSNGKSYQIYGSTGSIGTSNEYDYEGDHILIARVGANAGAMYRVSGKYKVSDNTLIISLDSNTSTSFVQYSLWNFNLNKLVFGSGQPLITGGQLKSIKLGFPSKSEQGKIADFLTSVDERIAAGETKLKLLKKYRVGVMQEIFSQSIRFKDDRRNTFPHWEERLLGEVADFINGYTFLSSTYKEGAKYKVVTIANVQQGFMNMETSNKVDLIPANIQAPQVLKIGDILISMTGNVGRTCLVNEENCLLNQRVGKIVPHSIEKDYLYHAMSTPHFVSAMISSGQGGAQDNLSSNDIKSYRISVPSSTEQQKIANFFNTLDDKITAEQAHLTAAKRWKKGLLQRMFI